LLAAVILKTMEEFFNKLKNMHGVTRLDLRGSDIDSAKHLYVTVSKMYCTANEVGEVQKMLHKQTWFQWTFNLVP
jgi:hypothetical protein